MTTTGKVGWSAGAEIPPAVLNVPTLDSVLEASANAIDISWTPPIDKADASGYRVYYMPNRKFAVYKIWGDNTARIVGDENGDAFDPGVTYSFIVVTTDGSAVESIDSNELSVTMGPAAIVGEGLLIRDPRTSTGFMVRDPSFQSTIITGDGLLIADPRTVTGLRVSDPSGALPPTTPVEAPTLTNLIALNDSALRVTFTDNQQPTPSTGFLVYVQKSSDGSKPAGYDPFKQIGNDGSGIHDIPLLEASTSYDVYMVAISGTDQSGASNTLSKATSATNVTPPPVAGTVYFDDFESGTYTQPSINLIGAQTPYMWGDNEAPFTSGVSTERPKNGAYSLKWGSLETNNINSGKFQIFWDTPLPDIWVAYDAWIGPEWDILDGHQKLLFLWEDEYGTDFTTPHRTIVGFESQYADNVSDRSHITYQTSSDTSINKQQRANSGIDDNGVRAKYPILGGADLNRWVRIVWHVRVAQTSSELGVFEFWKDGVLLMRQNVPNYVATSITRGYRRIYIFGNASNGMAEHCNKYIDNFQISTTAIT